MLSCVPYCAELMRDATISQQGRVRHDDVNRVARRAIGLMCSNGLRNMALVLISCIPTWGGTVGCQVAVSNEPHATLDGGGDQGRQSQEGRLLDLMRGLNGRHLPLC